MDAFVRCRCWEDGAVKPPPIPATAIGVDEEGYLGPLKPFSDEDWYLVQTWALDACQHPYLEATTAYFGERRIRAFRQALETMGWQHFPTLQAELRESVDGQIPAGLAARILDELTHFTETDDHKWVFKSLMRLCQASVATGNPVVWC
jgi:hypothetical protein